MERKVCHRPAPQFRWFCKSCGKGFTTSGGKLYVSSSFTQEISASNKLFQHEQNRVCEAHEIAKATPPTLQPQQGPVVIKPMPSPQLADGLPSPGYAGKPNSAQAPPVTGPQYQQAPYHTPYSAPHDVPRITQNSLAHTLLSWLPQRAELQPQPPVPNYPDLRASNGSSFQTTPVRSSLSSEQKPGVTPVLDPATENEMNEKIAAEVARFEKKCREIPDTLSAVDREEALNKEKRGHATRKSQIRKKYGIQIRTSKLQPANFVRIPGQGDAPVLAPISRIAAFRAPTYAISTPSSIEQVRQRPIMENPDPKRRKLEESPPVQQEPNSPSHPDPSSGPGELQHRMSTQSSPEVLEVDNPNKPDQPEPATEPQSSATSKAPKKVQWETLPREASPPENQPQPAPLREISNKASSQPKPPKSGKTDSDIVATTPEDGSDSGGEEEGSDVDLDADIPARLPPGVVPRRTRASARTSSLSASPAPPASSSAAAAAKRTGSTRLFSSSASSSRRSSESGTGAAAGAGAERRGSLGGTRVRAVVQV